MIIKRILSNSTLYDFGTSLIGGHVSDRNMVELLGAIPPGARILDAGGGTGTIAKIFDPAHRYWCMDIDLARVRMAKKRGAGALVGDATRMPVGNGVIDLVVLRAVSHHLADDAFAMMVEESCRVLKPGGALLFLDAMSAPSLLSSRIMWRIDQGSHPRSEDEIRAFLGARFEIERHMTYTRYHRYFLTLARPKTVIEGNPEAIAT